MTGLWRGHTESRKPFRNEEERKWVWGKMKWGFGAVGGKYGGRDRRRECEV